MKARKHERPETEEADGDERLDPAISRLWVCESKPKVHGIARLHRNEGAPDEDGAGVEEACDDVAEQEEDVAPGGVDFLLQVRLDTADC